MGAELPSATISDKTLECESIEATESVEIIKIIKTTETTETVEFADEYPGEHISELVNNSVLPENNHVDNLISDLLNDLLNNLLNDHVNNRVARENNYCDKASTTDGHTTSCGASSNDWTAEDDHGEPVGVSAIPVGVSAIPVGISAIPVGASAIPVGVSAIPVGVSAIPVGVPTIPHPRRDGQLGRGVRRHPRPRLDDLVGNVTTYRSNYVKDQEPKWTEIMAGKEKL